MEVINQPLRRSGDGALLLNRPGDCTVRIEKHAAVLHHTRNQRTALLRSLGDRLRRRKGFGVLLNPLHAEQFGADGLVQTAKGDRRRTILGWNLGFFSHNGRHPKLGYFAKAILVDSSAPTCQEKTVEEGKPRRFNKSPPRQTRRET